MLVIVAIGAAFVGGIAVYLHQKSTTQAKIAAAVESAVADAKKAASTVVSKV